MRYLIIILFFITPALAGTYGDNARGIEAYEEGDYQEALTNFRSALMTEPEHPLIRHNVALSFYKMGEYEKALQELEKAYGSAEEPIEKADIQYDMGNVYFQTDSLTRAILHYQKALELNPDDQDAKYNLELARALLKEFSEKQQQQQQQQNQEQQEQQQQQQEQEQQEEQQQEQEQQPSPEEMSQEEAERLLDALEEDEEDLQQEKIRRQGSGRAGHEKPW